MPRISSTKAKSHPFTSDNGQMERRAFLPLLSSVAFGQYEESKGDVPWVPTPDEVMETLFRMAKLTAQDVVYDLGSGDGRVVIYAAKKFGARSTMALFSAMSPSMARSRSSLA